jgi:hypothetical protein
MKKNLLKFGIPIVLFTVTLFIVGPSCSGDSTTNVSPIIESPIASYGATEDVFMDIIDPDCSLNYMTNGSFNNTSVSPDVHSDEDIIAATGWRRLFQNMIGGDLYSATTSAFTAKPSPASGNYAGMWITNRTVASDLGYREGMFNRMHRYIKPGTGAVLSSYILSFKTAKLNNFTNEVEFNVYGVNYDDIKPAALPINPIGTFNPANVELFGKANTYLLGTITINAKDSAVWVNQNLTFNSNQPNFPTGGINYILITKSEKQAAGIAYCAFDDFCLVKK